MLFFVLIILCIFKYLASSYNDGFDNFYFYVNEAIFVSMCIVFVKLMISLKKYYNFEY